MITPARGPAAKEKQKLMVQTHQDAPVYEGPPQSWHLDKARVLRALEGNPVRHSDPPWSLGKLPILLHGESKLLSMSFMFTKLLASTPPALTTIILPPALQL